MNNNWWSAFYGMRMVNVKYPYGGNMIVVNNHGKRQVREVLEYEKPER